MIRMLKLEIGLILLLVLVGGLIGLARSPAASAEAVGYATLEADLDPFRADFNAAQDHVRAVLLVGPT